MDGILIQKEAGIYNQNILPDFANFEQPFVWNIVSGRTNAIVENIEVGQVAYDGNFVCSMLIAGTGQCVFNVGDTRLDVVANNFNQHLISFRLRTENAGVEGTFVASAFINGVEHEIVCEMTAENGFIPNQWNTFYQIVNVLNSDPISFNFKIQSNSVGETFYFDGFKMEAMNNNQTLPSIYTFPETEMIWNMRVDTTNTQNLTASTENSFGFAGVLSQRGSDIILSATGEITPRKLNRVISVDYAFDLLIPSGSNHHIDVHLTVDGVIYRGNSVYFVKSTGASQHISGSWVVPVGDGFDGFPAIITLYPNVNCTISNRFLSVVEYV